MKHFIALFCVALIVMSKVGGLHALVHHTDEAEDQHCEVCLISTTVNLTPLLETDPPALPKAEYFFSEQKVKNLTTTVVFNNRHLSGHLLTRPPPQLS